MRGAVVVVIGGLLGGGACASQPPPELPPSPVAEMAVDRPDTEVERTFLRGLVALKLGDYGTAHREIGRVAYSCSGAPVGVRALLTLASLELDPRNSAGDPAFARRLVERYFELSERPAWTEPAARTLYLVALELDPGAEVESTSEEDEASTGDSDGGASGGMSDPGSSEASEERRAAAPVLGTSPGGPAFREEECAAAREEITTGALQRPSLPRVPLAARARALAGERDSLQALADRRERQLVELRQELERIRETLRP